MIQKLYLPLVAIIVAIAIIVLLPPAITTSPTLQNWIKAAVILGSWLSFNCKSSRFATIMGIISVGCIVMTMTVCDPFFVQKFRLFEPIYDLLIGTKNLLNFVVSIFVTLGVASLQFQIRQICTNLLYEKFN